MTVLPLSLCMITSREKMDLLLMNSDGCEIIIHRKQKGNDKETIDYIEKEIKSILVFKEWPKKMQKPRKK